MYIYLYIHVYIYIYTYTYEVKAASLHRYEPCLRSIPKYSS